MRESVDFLIVGGGVMGLAVGNALLDLDLGYKVLIAEKEDRIGAHTSTRNSGVLHAGFYYSTETLKARFCVDGNRLMTEYAKKKNIDLRNIGKVVLAKNDAEYQRLLTLLERGTANGCSLELLQPHDLKSIEPLAQTKHPFIWSPKTSVVDASSVMQSLLGDFTKKGGRLSLDSTVGFAKDNDGVTISGKSVDVGLVINLAGNYALSIAKSVGIGEEYGLLPVLGAYKETEEVNLPLKTLVYPVPHPVNPFLGVHLTPTVRGTVKVGPTALPVFGPEQYSIRNRPTFHQLLESLSSLQRFGRLQSSALMAIIRTEFPYLSLNNVLKDVAQLVPDAAKSAGWKHLKPGIRAQLINKNSGQFVSDFVVKRSDNILHVLNVVSPGFTSALSFGRYVADVAIGRELVV